MLFSSGVFLLLFLPAVLFLYYLPLRRRRLGQNILLLAASLGFYAWGEKWFVLVMMGSIVLNWLLGLWAGRRREAERSVRLPVILAAAANLSLLFVFKYLTFTLTNLHLLGLCPVVPVIELPIGISFFTFQAMSYVLDVARGRGPAQRNLLNVGLYISFFPQLIAGPIVKYETVAEELLCRRESWEDFSAGTARFVCGLAKKVLLANQLALCADRILASDPAALPMTTAWIGAVAYSLQLYFDFSGYSDMAIGLGRMFGFHFLENFNYPYLSRSASEFWRRWHISLGVWFRDYLYIPLGGSRVSAPRHIFNLFVVWLCTGLWHGANWTFLLWGMYYFFWLTAEKLFLGGALDRAPRWAGHLYTLLVAVVGWTIFAIPDLSALALYLRSMIGLGGGLWSAQSLYFLRENGLLLAAGALCSLPFAPWLSAKAKGWGAVGELGRAALTLAALIAVTVLLARGTYNPFIYFNF